MNIDKIILTHVRIPLREPFRISSGSVSEKEAIIVALQSDGVTGYGEASPMSGSFYSDDTPDSAWKHLVEVIAPRVLDMKLANIDGLNSLLDRLGGSAFARSGIETAAWDLDARMSGKSLAVLLNGSLAEVESGLAVGIYPSIGDLLEAIENYLKEGYRRLKIKIEKGWDIEALRAVRKAFGNLPLMVDANCAYDREDIEYLRRLDEFDLMMIEQPLKKKDLEGHLILQKLISTPICLDESADDVVSVKRAIELGSCKIVNIKIQRVGGFRNAKLIHDLCKNAGIPVWAGTMPELGIGGIHSLFLSSLPGFSYPTDVESSARWFVDDIVQPRLQVHDGVLKIEDYCSYDIDMEVVRKYKVRDFVASRSMQIKKQ